MEDHLSLERYLNLIDARDAAERLSLLLDFAMWLEFRPEKEISLRQKPQAGLDEAIDRFLEDHPDFALRLDDGMDMRPRFCKVCGTVVWNPSTTKCPGIKKKKAKGSGFIACKAPLEPLPDDSRERLRDKAKKVLTREGNEAVRIHSAAGLIRRGLPGAREYEQGPPVEDVTLPRGALLEEVERLTDTDWFSLQRAMEETESAELPRGRDSRLPQGVDIGERYKDYCRFHKQIRNVYQYLWHRIENGGAGLPFFPEVEKQLEFHQPLEIPAGFMNSLSRPKPGQKLERKHIAFIVNALRRFSHSEVAQSFQSQFHFQISVRTISKYRSGKRKTGRSRSGTVRTSGRGEPPKTQG